MLNYLGTSLRRSSWRDKKLIFNVNEPLSVFNEMNICFKNWVLNILLQPIGSLEQSEDPTNQIASYRQPLRYQLTMLHLIWLLDIVLEYINQV